MRVCPIARKGQLGNLPKIPISRGGEMTSQYQEAPTTEFNAKNGLALYIAFELSRKKWKLGISDGRSRSVRIVTIAAQDWKAFEREVEKARRHYGLEETTPLRTCYEIGREGFWIHRALIQQDIDNVVVDAASIEVNRRRKRAKTDRMDAEKLVRQLIRYWDGDQRVWSVVRVPDAEAEDARQVHRDMEVLKRERTRHRLRIQSLLFTQGIDIAVNAKFLERLDQLRCWDETPLPERMKARLRREYQRLQIVNADLLSLRKQQENQLKSEKTPAMNKVTRLEQLRGIGRTSSWVFVMELFGWRHFDNRRQLASAIGITPTPYQSGDSEREQGISRSGNRRIRSLAVEIAWSWLRFQPTSRLSRWYQQRFGAGGPRLRKIGIVAMARRLVIDLWRYLEQGIMPEGARLKTC
jgi:transposase